MVSNAPVASAHQGGGTYAFIDESVVAQTFAMRREAPEPEPLGEGPVLTPGWAYGSVIRDPGTGLFRMWYMSSPAYCEYYATSEDGIAWERPKLDLVSPELGAGPNAFMSVWQRDAGGAWLVGETGPEGFSVIDADVQPHPAAKARFTALYLASFGERCKMPTFCGLCLAHSDDGLHWRADEHNPVIPGWHDTSNCLMYDERTGKYLILGRPPVYVETGTHANRLVSRMESEDLIHWSSPLVILDTDDRDADAFELTDEGRLKKGVDEIPEEATVKIRGRDRQFYGMTGFHDAGMYIGLAQMYDVPSGNTWLELVHSRDGLDWIREPRREPYIPSRPDTWERQVRPAMATPPVAVGDELWIYWFDSC